MPTLQDVLRVFITMPINKSNKPTYLLPSRQHKAPRFVLFVYEQSVFAHSSTNQLGSSALIVVYKSGLSCFMMQAIAKQSKHPATVFLNQADIKKPLCPIRWFNQSNEIKRCGHGTLAAAKFLNAWLRVTPQKFIANSGEIFVVTKKVKSVQLKLNCITSEAIATNSLLKKAIKANIKQVFKTADSGGYTSVIIDDSQPLATLEPNIYDLKNHPNAVIILQESNLYNRVQWQFRYFAPNFGINEDSATGSALSVIAPIINNLTMVNKGRLIQCSANGAIINYALRGNNVVIS